MYYSFTFHEKNIPKSSVSTIHRMDMFPFYNVMNAELYDDLESVEKNIKTKLRDQNFSNFIKSQSVLEDLGECKYYTTDEYCKKISKKNLADDHANDNSLGILASNLRSLDKHFGEYVAMLSSLDFPAIQCISEIGQKNIGSRKKQLERMGYRMRSELPNKIRGGVAFIFNEKYTVKKRKDLKIQRSKNDKDLDIENLWYEIDLPMGKTIIGAIYKHPNSTAKGMKSFKEQLEKNMKKINAERKCAIIMGDLNLDGLRISHNENIKSFFSSILDHEFFPLITLPTRIQEDKCTNIDHIIVNMQFIRKTSTRTPGILFHDISDHLPTFLVADSKMKTKTLKNRSKVRIFGNKNVAKFKQGLQTSDWSNLYKAEDPTSALDEFYQIYDKLYEESFPMRTLSRKRAKDKDWVTPELRHQMNIRNALHQKSLLRPSAANKEAFRKARNHVTNLLRKAEETHYKNMINEEKNNLKGLWDIAGKIINPKKSKKNTIINSLLVNGKTISDDTQISNTMNDFFSTIGKKLADKIKVKQDFKKYLQAANMNSMFLELSDIQEIKKIIMGLKSSKAGGHDQIKPGLIKECCEYVSGPITHIINLSLKTAVVPQKLKIAKVSPIFKKDEKTDPGNYRPISLLSTINKIMEKVMYKRVISFLNRFKILYKYQFGFRENYSTVQAVIEITDNILSELEKKNMVAGIYLDLSKAFDTVDHTILLHKMKHYGIRGLPLKWFQSYLSNRQQYTVANGAKSELRQVEYGVPQGSVLGPLLFLIYVNDISASTGENKLRLFADDSNVFVIAKDPATLKTNMIKVILNLCEWFNANKLTINMKKTAYTIFTSNSKVPGSLNNIMINGTKVDRVQSVKYLGMTLDEKLNWKEHTEKLLTKLTKTNQAFKIVKNFVSKKQKAALYYAYFYSALQYGIEVYSQGPSNNLKKLQVKQNRALKTLHNKDFLTPTIELHKECNLLLVKDIAKLNTVKFVFKQRNGLAPDAFHNYYIENMFIHQHSTRQAKNIHVTQHRNTYGQKSVKYRGAIWWNQIKSSIREAGTIQTFSKNTKKSYINNYQLI